jgi:hypothetical protein
MAYIGRSPEYGNAVSQQITGTNSVGPYTLSYDTSTSGVVISLDGVVQRNSVDFNIAGTVLTFTSTVGTGIIINVVFTGLTLSFPTPSDGSVTLAKMAADSVDGTKIADDAIDSEHYTAASIDEPHLADNSVDSRAYVDASIDSEHLATGIILNDVLLKDYGEVTDAKGNLGATPAFDLTAGNSKTGTVSEAITSSTFTNPTATDELCAFSLMLTNGGAFSVSWPTTVDWAGATAPTLTASGVDCLVFWTIDGGTIWNGSTVALNLS